jgi:NAD(P)-dependent dehydrogenase (short-subunit alcohol dehydrogenase family)
VYPQDLLNALRLTVSGITIGYFTDASGRVQGQATHAFLERFLHISASARRICHGPVVKVPRLKDRLQPSSCQVKSKMDRNTESNMARMAGKIALITGAAQGLGQAMADMFVAEGAHVFMTDVNFAKVSAAAALHGDKAAAFAHDVTSPEQWQAAVAACVARFGGLNVLVNNAGIGLMSDVESCSLEEWRLTHAIDLDGVFYGCKYALAAMAKSTRETNTRGSILNISSIAGVIAAANMAAYNSAKSAVKHLSKSVALHCAKSGYPITCNSLHPVFIDTPILDGMVGTSVATREEGLKKLSRQIPLGKVGEPNDVAYAAVYLCSDEAKFVTGTELYIDGGISAQ